MDTLQLIKKIEQASAVLGVSPATITSRAVSNSRLYERLKNPRMRGGYCSPQVAERLSAWIDDATALREAAE